MPTQHAVLIVDADPKGLESLVYGFQGADWRMTACPSPDTASLLVKASGAEVIVIATRTEHDRTRALVRQLRAQDDFRSLPILVLGPEELRSDLKEENDVELLPLPAFVRDVLTASEILVTASVATAQGAAEPCLRFAATTTKTLSLVRTMNGLLRSGQLRLERNGRTGEILFHQGELTAASVGPLQGMAAVQHLMIWTDGKAELRLRHVPRRGQLHLGPSEFVQEMDRFQRDFAHAMKEIGPPAAVYSANHERLKQSSGAVPAEVTPVVRLCNGTRTLSDVIDESPFRVLDTVRILGRLAELGVLKRSDGKPLVPHPHDEFLENARISGDQASWPMPAPIASPAATAPVVRSPTPPPAAASGAVIVAAAKSDLSGPVTPPPVDAASQVTPPPAEPRRRRQTLELGIPPASPPAAAVAPAPAVTQPPTATQRIAPRVAEAAKTPAPVRTVTPAPVRTVTPAPVRTVTPAPVAPVPTIVVGTPPAPQPIAAPSATALQASGAFAQPHGHAGPAPAHSMSPTPSLSPTPPPSRRAGEITHAAGVIDSSKHQRRSQNLRAVGAPSVVISAMAAEPVKTPAPVPSSSAAVAPAQPVRTATPPVGGILEVKPSRRTASQLPAAQMSIQVDTSLSAPAPAPPPSVAKPDTGIRITGEMHIPPSGRTTRNLGKAAPKASSFHIDPSLTEPRPSGKTPRPVAVGGPPAASGKTPRPIAVGSQPTASKRGDSRPIALGRTDSRPIDGPKRHQSGSFSSVEADFFAREADLYKEEKTESFADLDDKKGKSAAKGKAGKPGRPYRR